MTAHKHFKALVRTRMQKTGESYSTARRQVLCSAPATSARDATRWHLPGNIPATTALRGILNAAGVHDPRTKQPIAESLLFLIAGGIGIGVAQFFYEKEGFASLFLAGRHLWQDPQAYLELALGRFGIKPKVTESGGAKAAEKQLRDLLANERPCVAWVDMTHLPHRAMPQEFSGGGYHVITAYRIDDDAGAALIGDLTDGPIAIELGALATARARIKSFKHRLLAIPDSAAPSDLRPLVRAGLKACAEGLVAKPKKGFPTMFNLEGVRAWGERLHGATAKDAWERVFEPGRRLWTGLTSIHEYIEHYGTGGGLCRPLFSEALGEAADLLGDAKLRALAERYAALGRMWSELADAALPDDVPLFRKAREAHIRRSELMASDEPGAVEGVRAAWAELHALRNEAADSFPLAREDANGLCASLQKRVLDIHAAEVAALEQLRACAP